MKEDLILLRIDGKREREIYTALKQAGIECDDSKYVVKNATELHELLATSSKAELKIWLDLNGLKIKRVAKLSEKRHAGDNMYLELERIWK